MTHAALKAPDAELQVALVIDDDTLDAKKHIITELTKINSKQDHPS